MTEQPETRFARVGDVHIAYQVVGDGPSSEQPAIVGTNDGTLVAMLLAATRPDRCSSLALFTPTAKHVLPEELGSVEAVVAEISDSIDDSGVAWLAPSRIGDEAFDRQLLRFQRNSVRIGAMAHYYRQTLAAEVGDVLSAIRCPTLVLNRSANRIVSFDQSAEVAAAIPDAKLVELPGEDHLIFSQDIDRVADELEEFLTGARSGRDPDRRLATLLFTDIVGSTTKAAELGDRRWRDLLDQHHAAMRAELARFGGREISTSGDGFFATFDSPTQAVRCALAASDRVRSLGMTIRAGVHTGEVEIRGRDLGGLAVHIGARVAASAGPGEVMVSSTVRDLLAGSDLAFDDRGDHELKGVPGTWRLHAVRPPL